MFSATEEQEGWRTPDSSWPGMEADEDGDILLISWALGLDREQPELDLVQRALREQVRADLLQRKQHKRELLQEMQLPITFPGLVANNYT
jgi:hypothetical protein